MALNINGTTGISGVDGSVSAPAVTGTDSNTGITFPAADTIKFSTDGAERMQITNSGVTGTGIPIVPPAFRAYLGSAQTLANATSSVIIFGTETFDSNSFYNTSDGKFTPTIAGYYFINAQLQFSQSTLNYRYRTRIYKNGSGILNNQSWNDGSNSELNNPISDIVSANGSSDYFQIVGEQHSGGNITITNGSTATFFSAFYIRPL
jgi:hypothetical protein